MRFRKLRIAFSATCGIACVLLIVLWVRSYSIGDSAFLNSMHSITSIRGRICLDVSIVWNEIVYASDPITLNVFRNDIRIESLEVDPGTHLVRENVSAPHWIIVVPSLTLGVIPWLRVRFSLRTLLIATTLVAVMLGLAVWAARQ